MQNRLKSKWLWLAAGIAGIAAIALIIYFYIPPRYYSKISEQQIKLPQRGSRLLIVAPHCDDETLGPGILLHRALEAGLEVKVLMVTNGDGFTLAVAEDFFTIHPSSLDYRKFGYQRQQESVAALKELGLKEDDIIFLGYPDTGVSRMWTEFWDSDKRYFSRYTQTDISPYKDSFDKRAPYTGESLMSDLDRVMGEYRPTHIYYPHPNDRHPDHWGVNAFVKYYLEEKKLKNVNEILYLVHRGNWPIPKLPEPDSRLYPPVKLTGLGTQWLQFVFKPGEAALKKSAILKYHTQIRAMRSFLLAFVRSSELLGKYPDYTLPRIRGAVPPGRTVGPAIADPVKDTATRDVDKASDITGVYSYINENRWVIEIAAQNPVQDSIMYRLHCRLFYTDGPVKRFDLTYHQGMVSFTQYARNSMPWIAGLKASRVNGRTQVIIPLSSIVGVKAAFLNADSAIGHFNIDKTAWRMLEFK